MNLINRGQSIFTDIYLKAIVALCMERRGVEKLTKSIDEERMMVQFVLPLNEIVVNFHDEIKSVSSGYASFDYEDYGFQEAKIIKVINVAF